LQASANNGSRAWLSRNRRQDSRVHFRTYLPSLIVSVRCRVDGRWSAPSRSTPSMSGPSAYLPPLRALTPTHATSCKNCSTLARQGHLSAPGGNIVLVAWHSPIPKRSRASRAVQVRAGRRSRR
jgi:hypothetical protein